MWHERIQVKKGDLGEKIVDAYLEEKKIVVYKTAFDGAHPFDRLLATPDKKQLIVADVKTKPQRKYYPDTGIDLRHFNEYQHISHKHNVKVMLFFVDQVAAKVYGNYLHELIKPLEIQHNNKTLQYPITEKNIIYFPLCKMIFIENLDNYQIDELKTLSSGRYSYEH